MASEYSLFHTVSRKARCGQPLKPLGHPNHGKDIGIVNTPTQPLFTKELYDQCVYPKSNFLAIKSKNSHNSFILQKKNVILPSDNLE